MTYYHYYRCGCVNWPTRWVEERSDSPVPGYDRKQHFEFDKLAKCQRYLRYSHSRQSLSNSGMNMAINDRMYGRWLIQRDARVKRGPTIAVMWDPETGRWYHGSCAHGIPNTNTAVPGVIRNYINSLEVAPDEWAFGWNCAEVECLVKAYQGGKRQQNLRGCYFIAYSVASPQGFYGACRTCRNWIRHFGGDYMQPNG